MKGYWKNLWICCCLAIAPGLLRADEGMWPVHLLSDRLVRMMAERGLLLEPGEIYNEAGTSLTDAVVALDFGCTGSLVSPEGLLLTNHHCAYGDIHALSTGQQNRLETGFWAMERSQEIPIPGKKAYLLRSALDVTEEVNRELEKSRIRNGKPMSRRVSREVERKYAEQTGLEALHYAYWQGERHFVLLYEVYADVRLVAAPPVSIGAFGGDRDNWQWPQHKGDFALYRIYTAPDGSGAPYAAGNIPLHPRRYLKVSDSGVRTGDFTMVIGYPGRTDRYRSSSGIASDRLLRNPLQTEIRTAQLEIVKRWMEQDPSVRLRYADRYFSLSNVCGMEAGETRCLERYGVEELRRQEERLLQQWADTLSGPGAGVYRGLLQGLDSAYAAEREMERNLIAYRELVARGTSIIRLAYRVNSLSRKFGTGTNDFVPARDTQFVRMTEDIYAGLDLRVEKELFRYAFREVVRRIDSCYWGRPLHRILDTLYAGDVERMLEEIWNRSPFADPDRFREMAAFPGGLDSLRMDPFFQVVTSVELGNFRGRALPGKRGTSSWYESHYRRALYRMRRDRGDLQYPDANSSARLSYGTVGGYAPADGIRYGDRTSAEGILEKENPGCYEYRLDPRLHGLLESADWDRWADPQDGRLPVNFLTDNDITGGNSGSPVLNAEGELVGLAFDGNRESLAGDVYFHPEFAKCVCVDIRYVLWVLDRYAGMEHLLREMGVAE